MVTLSNMGGGSHRKTTDQPIIRIPNDGAGVSSNKNEIADICIPSFEIKIDGEFKSNKPVSLDTASERCNVIIEEKVITELSKTQSEIVKKCEDLGVVYLGKIISDNNKQHYARFNRSSS